MRHYITKGMILSVLLAFCVSLMDRVLGITYKDSDLVDTSLYQFARVDHNDGIYMKEEKAFDCKRPRPPFELGPGSRSIWYPSCLSSEKEILHSLSKEEKIRLVSREDVKNIINQTPKREVMIWVWFPGKSKAEWTELIANVSKHRRIVTRICMGGFAIIENGQFGEGGPIHTRKDVEGYGPYFEKMGIKVTAMIAVNYGNLSYVLDLIYSDKKIEKFITDAIDEAKKFGLSGYNIDIELYCDIKHSTTYLKFLQRFGNALKKEGMTLTMDIWGSCTQTSHVSTFSDYMNMTCDMMKEASIKRAISMATYTNDSTVFKKYVSQVSKGLGSFYGVGVTKNKVLLSKECLDFAIESGVKEIDLWRNPPTSEEFWNSLAYFMYK